MSMADGLEGLVQHDDLTWVVLVDRAKQLVVLGIGSDGKEQRRITAPFEGGKLALGADSQGPAIVSWTESRLRVGRLKNDQLAWTVIPTSGKLLDAGLGANGTVVIAVTGASSNLDLIALRPDGSELARTATPVSSAHMLVASTGAVVLADGFSERSVRRYYDPNLVLRWRVSRFAEPAMFDANGGVLISGGGEVERLGIDGQSAMIGRFPWTGSATRAALTTSGQAFVLHTKSIDDSTLVLELVRLAPASTPKLALSPRKGERWRVSSGGAGFAGDANGSSYSSRESFERATTTIRKLDPDGHYVRDVQIDEIHVEAIAANRSGELVVTGWGGSEDLGVAKFGADGRQQWLRWFDGGGDVLKSYSDSDRGYAVRLDDDGSVVVAGQRFLDPTSQRDPWVIQLDRDGTRQWDKIISGQTVPARRVVSDGQGGLLVLGRDPNKETIYVTRFDRAGKELWTWSDKTGDYGEAALVANASGGAFVISPSPTGRDLQLLRIHEIDASAALKAQHDIAPGTLKRYGGNYVIAGAYQSATDLVIAGMVDPRGGTRSGFAARVSTGGQVIWTKRYPEPIHGVAVDDRGRIRVLMDGAIVAFDDWP
jgi:hypothetical protein